MISLITLRELFEYNYWARNRFRLIISWPTMLASTGKGQARAAAFLSIRLSV